MQKGKLKIVRRLFNGKEHILDIKEKTTLIGDIELLTDQPIVSSVVALEDTLVIQLPLTGIREELLADNDLLLNLSRGSLNHFMSKIFALLPIELHT